MDIASDPTGGGLSPTKLLPTSDANGKQEVPTIPTTSVRLGSISDVPTTPSSGLVNVLAHLTELKETFIYVCQLIKGHHKGH